MPLERTPSPGRPEPWHGRIQLLGAASTLLSADGGPGAFVGDLFGRVPFEDLVPYTAGGLADLAAAAHRRLAGPDGRSSLGIPLLRDATVERDGRLRDITVVELVNANRPFLLDSTLAELGEQGLTPLLVAHPILGVERDPLGTLVRVAGETTANVGEASVRESLIHVHVRRIDGEEARERLVAGLVAVHRDVMVATDDHEAMLARLGEVAERYRRSPVGSEGAEVVAFLDWLRSGNFTLLGIREHGPSGAPDDARDLGIARASDPRAQPCEPWPGVAAPEMVAFLDGPDAIAVTKGGAKSKVHRAVHLDHVAVKVPSPDGGPGGLAWIFGLFTASAYTGAARDVPYLRRKVAAVLGRAGLDPTSHAGRALLAVLENHPRDDLFQIDDDRLHRFSLAIAGLAERPRIRVLARPDRFGRFVSVLVYTFKDRYASDVRARIGEFLAERYGGRVSAFYPDLPDGPLARTHFIIGPTRAEALDHDPLDLEAGVARLTRTWGDDLREALATAMDDDRARALSARYVDAFSAAYRERYATRLAMEDISILEGLSEARPRAVDIGRRDTDPATRIRLQVFSRGASLPLSDRVPALEHLGFKVVDERTYDVLPAGGGEDARTWMHDMLLERAAGGAVDLDRLGTPLKAALLAMSDGLAESDGFNRLVLEAELGWRDAALLRAFGRYLRQLRVRYGQDYLAATLAAHPAVARCVVAFFSARFDPKAEGDRRVGEAQARASIETELAGVSSLDEDRILRHFVNLVEAAVRTDFFQRDADGLPLGTISFKFACAKVGGMALPRPLFEVFVHSPRVEGLHLRFGHVARGGLRWSDRPEDYRTEVLGLVKAQQVKNAVIVPVGAKGGFVPKRLPPASDRVAWLAEGRESYRIFIRALLGITDNIVDGRIVPPPDTVRHDPDDPYLVVAADKGTATFSDIANAISLERGHWLGDAFASGGSQGYDHKAMGITARGAWEAVKRHFREIDVDVGRDPVTVAGVGDMSGDVFGNGMLLSPSLRLVAAFDHRDVFLDPDPDPAASFAERERLFALPRSSWADYDRTLISAGGGVFPRSLKTIPLSHATRAALGVEAVEASPAELIQAILRAPVDLLWFGGIGTYVRSGAETDDDVGDRANDAVRVVGGALRAKVVGEGANLGLTQRGRIEAAQAGIRLNTDAIDNSAGVNTSDVEVNVKVALMVPARDGRLGADDRESLLASMTDEVAALVLRNNELQTLALSLCVRRGAGEADLALATMRAFEAEGRLDRGVEFLPDDAAVAERTRRGEGLTRPEYAVLLAYAKLALYDALLASSVLDDTHFDHELRHYFPEALRRRFPEEVANHRLRREIVATVLSNIVVNGGGPSFVTRLVQETGADAATVAKAYAATRDVLGIADMSAAVDAPGFDAGGQARLGLHADIQDVVGRHVAWFLRNLDLTGEITPLVTRYREGVATVLSSLSSALEPTALAGIAARESDLVGLGLDARAARLFAHANAMASALDIVLVSHAVGRSIPEVAATHHAVDRAFGLSALAASASAAPVLDAFDRLALERASTGIAMAHRSLTSGILGCAEGGSGAVAAWIARRAAAVARVRDAFDAMAATGFTVSKATVAAGLLGDLASSSSDTT